MSVQEYLQPLEDFLKENENKDTISGKVSAAITSGSQSVGLPRSQVAAGAVAIALLLFFLTSGMSFLACVVGTIYPAYRSFEAIESSNKDDDTVWLTYWVIFASLQIVEFFTDFILFWLPFYHWVKIAFLLWCMSPGPKNGSRILYHQVIRKFILKHKDKLDEIEERVNNVAEAAQEVLKED